MIHIIVGYHLFHYNIPRGQHFPDGFVTQNRYHIEILRENHWIVIQNQPEQYAILIFSDR